jgi:hypothetical protein
LLYPTLPAPSRARTLSLAPRLQPSNEASVLHRLHCADPLCRAVITDVTGRRRPAGRVPVLEIEGGREGARGGARAVWDGRAPMVNITSLSCSSSNRAGPKATNPKLWQTLKLSVFGHGFWNDPHAMAASPPPPVDGLGDAGGWRCCCCLLGEGCCSSSFKQRDREREHPLPSLRQTSALSISCHPSLLECTLFGRVAKPPTTEHESL